MVKFLITNGISAALDDLIRNAQRDVILISPYVKVNQRLQSFIQDADRRGVRFTLIYGKSDIKAEEREWIDRLTNKRVGFVQNLHAKCYLNENTAIITSMNLYEFSQQNNDEMGILVSHTEDAELYQEIYGEFQRLGRGANPPILDQPSKTSPAAKPSAPRTRTTGRRVAEPSRAYKTSGHCIRCAKSVDFDPDKPLCGQCYQIWARYADPDYAEKYCHRCSKENATSMAKPLCRPCFRQAGDV